MQIGITSPPPPLMNERSASADPRPNIALIITDQHRADCLGIEGHPNLQTPNLDWIGAAGIRFRCAYSACPVCIPARRTLMTGVRPRTHGVVMNYDTPLEGPTLPGQLSRAGYQTHLVGKLHLWPQRKLYGFMSADWSDGPSSLPGIGEYGTFLEQEGVRLLDAGVAHGVNQNGFVARPWHLKEHLHFTNWVTDTALRFLRRRDPTVPFFLQIGFHQPHQPCTPPACYWDRYMAQELPEPYVADWARVFDAPQRGLTPVAWRVHLPKSIMKQYRAGYFGCINHIDDQLGRILEALPENTVLVFVSDHGEMLGDHQWMRKRTPFEASTRVPLLMRFPEFAGIAQPRVRDEVVELMDIMPTLLDAAGVPIPGSVEGRSLLPLLREKRSGWRSYIHGECSDIPTLHSGMHYLTNGRIKYIWYPGVGQEQLFDLCEDPREMRELSPHAERRGEIEHWRHILTGELEGRPEGFVKDGKLARLSGPTPPFLPGHENPTVSPKAVG